MNKNQGKMRERKNEAQRGTVKIDHPFRPIGFERRVVDIDCEEGRRCQPHDTVNPPDHNHPHLEAGRATAGCDAPGGGHGLGDVLPYADNPRHGVGGDR